MTMHPAAADQAQPTLNRLRSLHHRAVILLQHERRELGQPTEAAYELVERLEAQIMRMTRGQ
jgi:hypothetical protein